MQSSSRRITVASLIETEITEFEIEDPFTIHRATDFTTIQIEMTKEDYQIIVSENRELLYAIRGTVDIYHALTGTSDASVTVQFLDSDTGEVLDDADWYDWFAELAALQKNESAEIESETETEKRIKK